ncbi:hypothetical protein Pelo_12231 [Pelomyxa schiedti]|nr:hypothetical protein Pelo_12231 [Pelomyxa schiedti]
MTRWSAVVLVLLALSYEYMCEQQDEAAPAPLPVAIQIDMEHAVGASPATFSGREAGLVVPKPKHYVAPSAEGAVSRAKTNHVLKLGAQQTAEFAEMLMSRESNLYQIRSCIGDSCYISSVEKCRLYGSYNPSDNFMLIRDSLSITLDQTGNPFALNYIIQAPCLAELPKGFQSSSLQVTFRTNISTFSPLEGKRIVQDPPAPAQQEPQKGILSRYWYIFAALGGFVIINMFFGGGGGDSQDQSQQQTTQTAAAPTTSKATSTGVRKRKK